MTTPEPTVIERIHRIGIDLSVLLELNDVATARTPLVSEAIRAIGDDDATTVLQLFSWDDTVCLRRARTVLADAVDRFDDRKRGVDGDPNPFESMVAVYHLACGCTVESGPGETRLMVGQQWACPGGANAGLQEVVAVTFTAPTSPLVKLISTIERTIQRIAPGVTIVFDNTPLLARREEVTPQEPPAT